MTSKDPFFGSCEKPELLQKLEEYQEDKGVSWEHLGFYISYDLHYSITPLDVIPFAGTGGDGIHFGFLTDFNFQKNLSMSPIVSIHPGDDPPIRIVAQNLEEFIKTIISIHEAELIIGNFETDIQLLEKKTNWFQIQRTDWQGNPLSLNEFLGLKKRHKDQSDKRNGLLGILTSDFGLEPKVNIIGELNEFKRRRLTEITSQTLDGIGIKLNSSDSIQEFDYSIKNPERISAFLSATNLNSRITFYRNATSTYILSATFDKEIKTIIAQHLKEDDLHREAKILEGY